MGKLKIKSFDEIKTYVESKKFIQEDKVKEYLQNYLIQFPQISDYIVESYYLYIKNLAEIPKCPICSSNRKFINFNKGYYTTCNSKECKDKFTYQQIKKSFKDNYGVENPSNIKEVQEKRTQTFIKKYGVKNPYQAEDVKAKIKQTLLANYGVDNPMKSLKIRDKAVTTLLKRYGITNAYQIQNVLDKLKEKYGGNFGFGSEFFKGRSKETCLEKYGHEFFLSDKELHKTITKTMVDLYGGRGMGSSEIKKKIEETNLEKYGDKVPSKTKKCKDKSIETCLKKYGTNHHMQNIEIFEKNSKSAYKWKIIKFPSGRIEKVQGYEPQAIDELLKNGYDENDIVLSNKEIEKYIGKIFYTFKDKMHRYYPDIYIISENKIIEVKSKYTYNYHLQMNLAKQKTCLDKGLKFEFNILESSSN